MPATPARIGFIQEEFRRAVATTSSAQTRHGNLARESADPVETWFDDVDDAEAVAQERQILLSPERRRFSATTTGLEEVMALDFTGPVPVAQFTDTELVADRKTLISEVTLDFEKQGATINLWG